jgi:uncharacterized protein (DUF58 family)
MPLTRTGKTLRAGGIALALLGILFGNWPIFGAGALLLTLVAFAGLPQAPEVRASVDQVRIERGGHFTFTMDVRLPRGPGLVEVHQWLPEEFELVEGSNLHLLTLGFRRRQVTKAFKVRVPKRGEWTLPPASAKLVQSLGLSEGVVEGVGGPVTLTVEPRPIAARIPRDMRTRARRPFPDGDLARMGVATNDFRELREYVPGDPIRRINWKATARRIGTGAGEVPLVNETEWEGKKAVWIVVDGHARLSVGTNVEDARERAADAALSLMETYLRRGYRVGMALARSGDLPCLRPGTGESQVLRARELLSRLQEADSPGILDTLQRDALHLHKSRPLVILITRLAGNDPDLEAAIRRLGAMGHLNGRNVVPGLIIDLDPTRPHPEDPILDLANQALENERLALHAQARAANLRVTRWRIDKEPLEAVLLRGRIS